MWSVKYETRSPSLCPVAVTLHSAPVTPELAKARSHQLFLSPAFSCERALAAAQTSCSGPCLQDPGRGLARKAAQSLSQWAATATGSGMQAAGAPTAVRSPGCVPTSPGVTPPSPALTLNLLWGAFLCSQGATEKGVGLDPLGLAMPSTLAVPVGTAL